MKKQWRMIGCLAGGASFYCLGGLAVGQTSIEPPQYPQYVQYPQGAPPVAPGVPAAQVTLTADQIDQLLGPIALYPDPLLSLIFPAATYPQDVTAAEQWLASTPNPTEATIDAQNWDASIKGLVHYPTVLKMMSDQIDWTQTVGAAFLNQQPDVLASVQRLRALAEAAHNLQTTQQNQIVTDGSAIRIEPVDPNVIYVPQYDPALVYTSACPITFSVGFPIGLWVDNDFDWNHHDIVIGGGWYRGWHHPAEWDQHPPAWDRHPAGWAPAPKPWVRAPSRPPPRITPGIVTHLGLDHPRGAVNPAPGRGPAPHAPPLPAGRQPAPPRSAFEPSNRNQVQQSVQRAHPAPVAPPRVEAPPAPRPNVAPQRVAPPPAAPRQQAPAPRSAPGNAFNGGLGGAARAQSTRGNASVHK